MQIYTQIMHQMIQLLAGIPTKDKHKIRKRDMEDNTNHRKAVAGIQHRNLFENNIYLMHK